MAYYTKSYSAREKAAYNAGRGYAAAKSGRRFNFNNSKLKQSFKNGYQSLRSHK